MAMFRCFIRGENVPFSIDGEWRTMGFYTTRFVEASSPEEAEMAALAMLRDEEDLVRDPSTPGLGSAKIFFEDIERVEVASGPNKGFTIFNEDAS